MYNGIMIKLYAKNKKFDAVRMLGKIRNKLSKRYSEDQEAERRDLQDVRRKYGIKRLSNNSKTGKKERMTGL